MSVQSAVRVRVHIAKDRTVHLPEDLPEGDAEIIVLYDTPPLSEALAKKAALRREAFGADAGKMVVSEDFDAPLPEDVQRYFEGDEDGPRVNAQ